MVISKQPVARPNEGTQRPCSFVPLQLYYRPPLMANDDSAPSFAGRRYDPTETGVMDFAARTECGALSAITRRCLRGGISDVFVTKENGGGGTGTDWQVDRRL